MKILKILLLLLPFISFSQSVNDLVAQAQHAYTSKNYKLASESYQKAFSQEEFENYFVYYYAALSANLNHEEDLAIKMLHKSITKGLGLNDSEIEFIENLPEFTNLHSKDGWKNAISQMKNLNTANKQKIQKQTDDWKNNLLNNKKIKDGYTLFFQKVDTIDFPYLVYVPKNPNSKGKLPLIVFLHGGTGYDQFQDLYENPELQREPIFTTARTLNAIVIYPIARTSFNWYDNEKCLEGVMKIVDNFESKLKYDKKKVILGGMSIGGRATFWFAENHPDKFSGFYTFSAIPELKFKTLDFSKFDKSRPIISVNAKDDTTFKINDVLNIYNQNKFDNWTLEILDKGTHGFIYNPEIDGQEKVTHTIQKLLQ